MKRKIFCPLVTEIIISFLDSVADFINFSSVSSTTRIKFSEIGISNIDIAGRIFKSIISKKKKEDVISVFLVKEMIKIDQIFVEMIQSSNIHQIPEECSLSNPGILEMFEEDNHKIFSIIKKKYSKLFDKTETTMLSFVVAHKAIKKKHQKILISAVASEKIPRSCEEYFIYECFKRENDEKSNISALKYFLEEKHFDIDNRKNELIKKSISKDDLNMLDYLFFSEKINFSFDIQVMIAHSSKNAIFRKNEKEKKKWIDFILKMIFSQKFDVKVLELVNFDDNIYSEKIIRKIFEERKEIENVDKFYLLEKLIYSKNSQYETLKFIISKYPNFLEKTSSHKICSLICSRFFDQHLDILNIFGESVVRHKKYESISLLDKFYSYSNIHDIRSLKIFSYQEVIDYVVLNSDDETFIKELNVKRVPLSRLMNVVSKKKDLVEYFCSKDIYVDNKELNIDLFVCKCIEDDEYHEVVLVLMKKIGKYFTNNTYDSLLTKIAETIDESDFSPEITEIVRKCNLMKK